MDLPVRGTRLPPRMGDEPENHPGASSADPQSGTPAESVELETAGGDDQEGTGGYRVELPVFEGPLDLLLHLIQQHELDILDIPIAFITQKYVEYVTLLRDLNIDVASEYLVMAATLTHIKSKMLLPASPEDEDEDEDAEADPRAELVRRLLEYQKYKEAAAQLGDRSILGRDIFSRGAPAPSVDGPAPLAPVGLFKLLDAFQAVLKRAKQGADHQIDVDRFSISDRINELSDILRERRRVQFEELFSDDQSRGDLIVTFLAILEMTRVRLIRLTQLGPLEPISIELAVDDLEMAEESTRAQGEAEAAEVPEVEGDDSAELSEESASESVAEQTDSAPLEPTEGAPTAEDDLSELATPEQRDRPERADPEPTTTPVEEPESETGEPELAAAGAPPGEDPEPAAADAAEEAELETDETEPATASGAGVESGATELEGAPPKEAENTPDDEARGRDGS